MPTYEYHCAKCDATYDLQQSFSAEPTHRCEQCGKGTAKRVLYAPRVVFKGGGFYATDNKGRSTATQEPASSKGESSGAKKGPSSGSSASPEAAAAS